MALKIRTVMTYPLTGAVDFAITFEYLARKFVTVTLIGKDRKELVLNQDYRFTTKTQITTTRAWTAADGYDSIEIRRYTSATDRLVDFADGSILRAYDLNIAQIQTLHVAEEARDLTADTIGVNNDGNLDARGRRIVNVANPVEDGDAVNLRSIKSWNDSALYSAKAAKVSEDNAKKSETRSVQAETRAVQAETRSITAETNSKNSETVAKKWAANPLGEIVANNMFSAFHYANQANLAAGAAKTSENNSASSASASATSAVTSKNEADRAKTEADKLGNMNALAEAIDKVVASDVYFKKGVRISNKASSFTGNTHGGDWKQWTSSLYPNLQHDIATQGDIAYLLERATIWSREHLYAKFLYNNGIGANFFIRHYLRNAYFDMRSDGALISSTGWNIPADGNLFIKKYSSNIDDWVNKRLEEHAYSQSQADERYVRKNAGWTVVWEGNAISGTSVALSQDVRWRTIWIKCNDHLFAYPIGGDGAYLLSTDLGWLKFAISNNGRTFRNNEDAQSVPTQIIASNN